MQASAAKASNAEIRRVWPRDGQIRVLGTLFVDGVPDDGPVDTPWTLLLTSRERPELPVRSGFQRFTDRIVRAATRTSPPTPRRLRFPVAVDGADFEAVVGMDDLAVWDALPSEIWDLHVIASRGTRKLVLRVGGHHDDMPGKKQIVKFPEQYRAGVAVMPYYTDADDLSIRCARRENADRSAT
ncbi:hypothetical protein [Streptomyces sp. NPDC021020]|uniref:hypothetical protein n=1 Tax=Streptomyces sp. NPDC021020 TaxID=3365109 RepID=UPI0037BBEB72